MYVWKHSQKHSQKHNQNQWSVANGHNLSYKPAQSLAPTHLLTHPLTWLEHVREFGMKQAKHVLLDRSELALDTLLVCDHVGVQIRTLEKLHLVVSCSTDISTESHRIASHHITSHQTKPNRTTSH